MPVQAQEYFGVPESPLVRHEKVPSDWSSVPVKKRQYQGFTPKGLKLRNFTYHQGMEIEVGHQSNVYLDNNNEQSDQYLAIKPELALSSDWNRHFVSVKAAGNFKEYADHSSEDAQDFRVQGRAQIDISRDLTGFAGLSYGQSHVDRHRIRSSVSPDSLYRQDSLRSEVGLAGEWGKRHYSIRLAYDNIRFSDALNRNNTSLKAIRSDADRDVVSIEGEFGHEITRNLKAYMQIAYRLLDFKRLKFNNALQNFSGANRDSKEVSIGVGVSGHFTKSVSGHAFVGVERRSFDQAGVQDADNQIANLGLSWNPTSLSTLGVSYARRLVTDNDIEGESLENKFRLNYDHELLRNFILSGSAQFIDTDFKTANREDEDVLLGLDGVYQLNDHIGLGLSGLYHQRDSSQNSNDFEDVLIMLRLKHAL